jgi:hypothetical protein
VVTGTGAAAQITESAGHIWGKLARRHGPPLALLDLWIGGPRSSSLAVSLTTLTFAIVLAVVKLWSRIRGGRGEYAS